MKHSSVRQNIIETASHLFYTNGYNLTGINEIISESGIAKATLYNHFRSKEDICISYIQFMNSKFLKDIEAYCLTKPNGNNQIHAIFDFLQLFFNTDEFNGCWCIKTSAEIPRNNQKIRDEIKFQKDQFIALIKKLVLINNIKNTDNEVNIISKQIYLLYEGAVSESHLHQDEWPIISAKSLAKKLLN